MAPVLGIPLNVFLERILEYFTVDEIFDKLCIEPFDVLSEYEDVILENKDKFSDVLTELDYLEEE